MLILYIDDDRDDIFFFQEALRMLTLQHTCIFAENGRMAIELLDQNERPDFIFLDINMPLMNGKETLRAIRKQPRFNNTPVIMLSTVMSTSDESELTRAGATRCLIKPFTPAQLYLDLSEILEGTREMFKSES